MKVLDPKVLYVCIAVLLSRLELVSCPTLVSPLTLSGGEGKSVLVDKDVLYIPTRQPEA